VIIDNNKNYNDKNEENDELDLENQIKKSRKDAIFYGSISTILTTSAFYLKFHAPINNPQIIEYFSSIILATGVPFFIATTSSIFNFHSLRDFPNGAQYHNLYKTSSLDFEINQSKNLGNLAKNIDSQNKKILQEIKQNNSISQSKSSSNHQSLYPSPSVIISNQQTQNLRNLKIDSSRII
jgi:hypothetical protein